MPEIIYPQEVLKEDKKVVVTPGIEPSTKPVDSWELYKSALGKTSSISAIGKLRPDTLTPEEQVVFNQLYPPPAPPSPGILDAATDIVNLAVSKAGRGALEAGPKAPFYISEWLNKTFNIPAAPWVKENRQKVMDFWSADSDWYQSKLPEESTARLVSEGVGGVAEFIGGTATAVLMTGGTALPGLAIKGLERAVSKTVVAKSIEEGFGSTLKRLAGKELSNIAAKSPMSAYQFALGGSALNLKELSEGDLTLGEFLGKTGVYAVQGGGMGRLSSIQVPKRLQFLGERLTNSTARLLGQTLALAEPPALLEEQRFATPGELAYSFILLGGFKAMEIGIAKASEVLRLPPTEIQERIKKAIEANPEVEPMGALLGLRVDALIKTPDYKILKTEQAKQEYVNKHVVQWKNDLETVYGEEVGSLIATIAARNIRWHEYDLANQFELLAPETKRGLLDSARLKAANEKKLSDMEYIALSLDESIIKKPVPTQELPPKPFEPPLPPEVESGEILASQYIDIAQKYQLAEHRAGEIMAPADIRATFKLEKEQSDILKKVENSKGTLRVEHSKEKTRFLDVVEATTNKKVGSIGSPAPRLKEADPFIKPSERPASSDYFIRTTQEGGFTKVTDAAPIKVPRHKNLDLFTASRGGLYFIYDGLTGRKVIKDSFTSADDAVLMAKRYFGAKESSKEAVELLNTHREKFSYDYSPRYRKPLLREIVTRQREAIVRGEIGNLGVARPLLRGLSPKLDEALDKDYFAKLQEAYTKTKSIRLKELLWNEIELYQLRSETQFGGRMDWQDYLASFSYGQPAVGRLLKETMEVVRGPDVENVGIKDKIKGGITTFGKLFGIPAWVARRHKDFEPFYAISRDGFAKEDSMLIELNKGTTSKWLALSKSEQITLSKILFEGNRRGIALPEFTVEEIKTRLRINLPSESLTPAMAETYYSIRATYDKAIEWFGESLIRNGSDPVQVRKQVAELVNQGYVPLKRFGDTVVTVRNKKTKAIEYFEGFEDAGGWIDKKTVKSGLRAARRRALELSQSFGTKGFDIEINELTSTQKLLFKDYDMASLSMMARFAKVKPDIRDEFMRDIYAYMSTAGMRKHLVPRGLIAGYSEDLVRTMASYNAGLASYISKNDMLREMNRELARLRRNKGNEALLEYASQYVEKVKNPGGEAVGMRNFLFLWYLGGVARAAIVNMTQPLTTTYVYLSQWAGDGEVLGILATAPRDMLRLGRKPDSTPFSLAYKRANDEGIVSPTEVHMMRGIGKGQMLAKREVYWKALEALSYMFSTAEEVNRKVSFLAGWRIANKLKAENRLPEFHKPLVREGISLKEKAAIEESLKTYDPVYEFARETVYRTQFEYHRYNRPLIASNAIGSVVFVFRNFILNYFEFFGSLPPAQKVRALGVLGMMGGVMGLPLAGAIADTADWMGKKLGHPMDLRHEFREAITEWTGHPEVAAALLHGVPRLTNVDIGASVSMGDVVPEFSVSGVAGAIGGMYNNAYWGRTYINKGQYGRMMEGFVPIALKGPLVAARWHREGVRDSQGRLLYTPDVQESISKVFGFQPGHVNETWAHDRYRRHIDQIRDTLNTYWSNSLKRAMLDKDSGEIDSIRKEVLNYNKTVNPDMQVSAEQVFENARRKLKEHHMTVKQVIERKTPRVARPGAVEASRKYYFEQ